MGKVIHNPFNKEDSNRMTYDIIPVPGHGYFLMTYDGKGGIEPFTGDPLPIKLEGFSLEENVSFLWNTLDRKTRCSIAGKEVDRDNGRFRYARILNRNWRKI